MASNLTSFWCTLWACLRALGCQVQAPIAKWLKPIVSMLSSHVHSQLMPVAFNSLQQAFWAHLLLHSAMRGLSRIKHEMLLVHFTCLMISQHTLWESPWHVSSWLAQSGLNSLHKWTAWQGWWRLGCEYEASLWFGSPASKLTSLELQDPAFLCSLILLGLGTVPAKRTFYICLDLDIDSWEFTITLRGPTTDLLNCLFKF